MASWCVTLRDTGWAHRGPVSAVKAGDMRICGIGAAQAEIGAERVSETPRHADQAITENMPANPLFGATESRDAVYVQVNAIVGIG